MKLRFLTMGEVLLILQDQIRRYGGAYGVRDPELLSSALGMPMTSFEGKYLHKDLYEQAAAYAFHLCPNHPFMDGNKRTALASVLVFLSLNGYSYDSEGILEELTAAAR
jgi:death on curing protein